MAKTGGKYPNESAKIFRNEAPHPKKKSRQKKSVCRMRKKGTFSVPPPRNDSTTLTMFLSIINI